MRLAGMPFRHEHILDTRHAPHGQLPYVEDDDMVLGDSSAIVAHLIDRHGLSIDAALTPTQCRQTFCINRVLDDLYWPMSYSRWKDERYWPQFRAAMLDQNPTLTNADLEGARAYNFERYRYQGIGRYPPEEAYRRGLDDLALIDGMLGETPFLFGDRPTSADASVYGFLANILFYPIDTPLRDYVRSRPRMERHCHAVHHQVTQG